MEDKSLLTGDFGLWHWQMFFLCTCMWIPMSWNTFATMFLAPQIKASCLSPYVWDRDINGTSDANWTDKSRQPHCVLITKDIDTETKCQQWDYDTSTFPSTIRAEWDLICDNEWLISLSTSIYMAGMMTGLMLFGFLSDRFGRRPATLISLALQMIAGIGAAFADSFVLFASLRFIIAMGASGSSHCAYAYFMECLPVSQRSTFGLLSIVGWVVGYLLLPGIAWLLPNWQHFQIAISVFSIIFIIIWIFQVESPRWLLTHGYLDRVKNAVERVGRLNRMDLSQIEDRITEAKLFIEKEREEKDKDKATPLDLVKTPVMRRQTFALFYLWIINIFIYYGLSLGVGSFAGNLFVNVAISAAVEIPSYLVTMLAIAFFGRRLCLCTFLLIGGIGCLSILAVPTSDDYSWLRMTLAMIGKSCITAADILVFVVTVELYPTVLRSMGLNICSTSARIGAICSPFLKELAHYKGANLPFIICGVLSIIGGGISLVLRETRGQPLQDTIEEVENYRRAPDTTEMQLCEQLEKI